MTTYHEPPAHSRRAARQSERGDTPEYVSEATTAGSVSPESFAPSPQPSPPSPEASYSDGAAPASSGRRSRVRAESQELHEVPTSPPLAAASASPAVPQPPLNSEDQGEPLTYVTQGAQFAAVPPAQVPPHQAPPAEAPALSLAERLQQASTVSAAASDDHGPAFRVRDFSPEGGRRAARAAEEASHEVSLTYQTQQAPPVPVAHTLVPTAEPEAAGTQHTPTASPEVVSPVDAPPMVAPPVVQQSVVAPPVVAPLVEQTLTRRELRALQAEKEAAAGLRDSTEVPPLIEPEMRSSQSTATDLSNAMAEFESLAREAQAKTAATQPPLNQVAPDSQLSTAPPVDTTIPPSFVGLAPPTLGSAVQAEALPAPAAIAPPPPVAPPVAPPVEPVSEVSARVELTPQFVEPQVEPVAEASYASTAGHWSRQAALDDETQPFENTLSRDVGGGNVSTATNALVLPTTSQLNDIASAINSTGEILVTGSITLPSALGSTGGDSRRYDDPDVDALFDAYDNELVATDSAPVSAIRAVSTHTSTHGVITANKPTGNRMLTVMMISAGVMGVAVFGLLIAGFVLNIF